MQHVRVGLVALIAAAPAFAGGGSALWSFDETTTGQDVLWISPTAVDPGAALFASTYQISLVEVDVTWFGIPIDNLDVTAQVPPELLSGADFAAGPAPVDLFDNPLEYPGPPDPPCLTADLLISLDAAGFGQLSGTNVFLGTCTIDIGPVVLQSVRIVGQISITALTCPWDLDGSGDVGVTDLLALLGAWGMPAAGPPDFDGDGFVGVADLLALLGHWGSC